MKILSLFVFIFVISACHQQTVFNKQQTAYEREYAKIANVRAAPPGRYYPSPKTAREKPEIGMGLAEFMDLCGKPDKVAIYESSRGKISSLTYEHSERRERKMCFGIFTFADTVLDSIYRD